MRAAVEDLATYPRWFTIVDSVTPTADGAWTVDLAARLGPIKRTKRVRMVRVAPGHFERSELDGKRHSPWVLRTDVHDDEHRPGGSRLRMHLHYGNTEFFPGMSVLLASEARRAAKRLDDMLRDGR